MTLLFCVSGYATTIIHIVDGGNKDDTEPAEHAENGSGHTHTGFCSFKDQHMHTKTEAGRLGGHFIFAFSRGFQGFFTRNARQNTVY